MRNNKKTTDSTQISFEDWRSCFLKEVAVTAEGWKHWEEVKSYYIRESTVLRFLYEHSGPKQGERARITRELIKRNADLVKQLIERLRTFDDEICEAQWALMSLAMSSSQPASSLIEPTVGLAAFDLLKKAKIYEASLRKMASKRSFTKEHLILWVLEPLRRRLGHLPSAAFATVLTAAYFANGQTERIVTPNGLNKLRSHFVKRHPAFELMDFGDE